MAIPVPNPAALAYSAGKMLAGPYEPYPLNPLDDSAIRASLLSQGLGQESGVVAGSNVPGVQVAGQPNFPTRQAVGLGGDAAFNDTATAFRQQLASQLGAQTASINREFGNVSRYSSGQRMGAIERAQADSRGAFGRFLSETALQKYLEEQRNATQLEAARIGAEAGKPGRAGIIGNIAGSAASIYGSNFDSINSFFSNRFGGGGDPNGFAMQPPASHVAEYEDWNKLL